MSSQLAVPALGARLRSGVRVLYWATRSGLADHGVIFTLRSWLLGWCLRMLSQVLFFVVIGELLGPGQTGYLLIGNAVLLMASHGLLATASTTWERENGTLALLVASPSAPALVLIGRSLFWIPEGLACALGALLLLAPLFGVSLPLTALLAIVPVLAVVGMSCYALGVFLGALMLRVVDLRNVVSNAVVVAMMILCGVNLPSGALGPVAGGLARVLPLTNGLQAIRDIQAGAPWAHIVVLVSLEAVVAAGWLGLAVLALRWLARRSRVDGQVLFCE